MFLIMLIIIQNLKLGDECDLYQQGKVFYLKFRFYQKMILILILINING
jgi:hypothetical protein